MTDDVWIMEPGKGSRVLELGATRDDILRRLKAAEIEIDEAEDEVDGDDDFGWVYVDEIEAELTFSATLPHVLTEIAISDDRVRLGPMEVIDEPLGKLVELLKVSNEETLWTHDNDDLTSSDAASDAATSQSAADGSAADANEKPPTDEELVKGATLWIRPFGLGLDLVYGDVLTLRLRRPEDVPAIGVGPLTPEQRALALRDDLSSHLFRSSPTTVASRPSSRLQGFVLLAAFVAFGLVVWRGVEYQRRWNEAPMAKATIVAVEPPPPEPFADEYTVAYVDQVGTRHEVVLDRNEVYGLPAIGETIELYYLPEAPNEPLGPARARDIAFEKYVPWGIGVVIAYFVLLPLVSLVESIWRKPSTA